MQIHEGRARVLNYEQLPQQDAGTSWMIGMFLELGRRTLDQVEHLDDEALDYAPEGSYLKTSVLLVHLVSSELNMLRIMMVDFTDPEYVSELSNSGSGDLPTMAGGGKKAVELLKKHLKFREELFARLGREPGYFDAPVENPRFASRREVLGHLIWHWANHSGHIGASTLSAGWEYIWK